MRGSKSLNQQIYDFLNSRGFFTETQSDDATVRSLLGLETAAPKATNGRELKIFVDGSADLTRKRSGIGGAFFLDGEEIYSFSKNIPDLTNNEAEYDALIHALELAVQFDVDAILVCSDSELMVNQINGSYKVRNERLQPRYKRVMKLMQQRPFIQVQHVYRTANKRADQLAQDAMRSKTG